MDSRNEINEGASTQDALLQISLAINERLELPDILSKVIQNTRALVDCKDASVVIWNSRSNRFEMGASTTDVGKAVANRVRRQGGASRWILDNRRPLVITDVHQDPFVPNPMLSEHRVGSYIGVPVQQGTEVLGVLYALSRRMRPFDKGELGKMQNIASMAAIAIRNAWLIKSLRELSDFKNAMIRMAAHDLREPLSLAEGFLDLLVDAFEPLKPEQLVRLNIIRRAHARMDDIIAGVLEYERLTGDTEMNRVPVDLNAITMEAVSSFEETAAQKLHTLTVELAPGSLTIQGDSLLLLGAINNLISNAIKYTPPGGIITIRTEESADFITLSVQDTGVGIDPGELENLFYPFVRLSSAGSEKGTGLGLSLVKIVVERHGGQVSADSSLAKGSVFQIHLPKDEEVI